jgi:uridine monophosphate synthetase
MSLSFFQRLTQRIEQVNSLLCVGLDPHPEFLEDQSPQAVRDFCTRLIEATSDFACAFKPNSAFFEALGPEGMAILKEVIEAVPEDVPVILDAKRGDIASTSEAYAQAIFQRLAADAVTLSPYLGWDAISPFLDEPEKGAFLLCKTSNPGASEIQNQLGVGGEPLFLHIAREAQRKNVSNNLGLVVGATDPQALRAVRDVAPEIWILAPGVGAQGGDLGEAMRAGLRQDAMGMVIPLSRALASAQNPGDEAKRMRDAINQIRETLVRIPSSAIPESLAPLADGLLEAGCIRFGEFTLKSGIKSPIYIDLRRLSSFPPLMAKAAAAYLPLLDGLDFDRLAAIPLAGIPIGTAISLQSGHPLVYSRKERKGYGTQALVEGEFRSGERVVVIDDLVSSGGSKIEAVEQLSAVDLIVEDIVVLIDRQQGASTFLKEAGYRLHTVFKLTQLLDYWEQNSSVEEPSIRQVRDFLGR